MADQETDPTATRDDGRGRRRAVVLVIAALAVLGAGAACAYVIAQRMHEAAVDKRVDACESLIHKHAVASGLPEDLLRRIIRAESGGRPKAVSSKNARGLMQITPIAEREVLSRSARPVPPGDIFDPDYNIFIGSSYLRMLSDRFGGDAYLVLASYHAGPTRVSRLRAAHPELSGQELVNRFAGAATRRYCQGLLGESPAQLPTMSPDRPQRAHTRVSDG